MARDPNGLPAWMGMAALQLVRLAVVVVLATPFTVAGILAWKMLG